MIESFNEIGDDLELNDRVLVEADAAGRPARFSAIMVKVCPTEVWLGLTNPDRRLRYLRPGQSVRLTIARQGAALVGRGAFLRSLGDSSSRIFAVARPEALDRVQRRAFARFDIGLPVQFRRIDPDTWEPRGRGAAGTTVNVSPGGLLLRTDAPVAVGEELNLTLPLSDWDRISTTDRVIRVTQPSTTEHEVAVKFTRITAIDREWIVRFVLAAEHRRREAARRQPASPRFMDTDATD